MEQEAHIQLFSWQYRCDGIEPDTPNKILKTKWRYEPGRTTCTEYGPCCWLQGSPCPLSGDTCPPCGTAGAPCTMGLLSIIINLNGAALS